MLTEAQTAQFHRDGFLRGGRVLSEDAVGVLQDEMARVIRDGGDAARPQPVMLHNMSKSDSPVWQIVDIWMASGPFRDLVVNPAIGAEIAQLTDARTVRLWHDQVQYKPAAVGGVNMWHQDAPLWPTLAPMTQVTAWVALDDVDMENGCMSMVPGSHRWGDRMAFLRDVNGFAGLPAEFEGHPVEVRACPVRRGEVHYHHALTWHGSSANVSGRPRRAVALHYMTEQTRYVAAGRHPMQPHITVGDGEMIQGDAFPVAWTAGDGR